MGKLLAAIIAVLMTACVSPKKPEPQIVSAIGGQNSTFTEPDSYLVRLNFVVFADEIDKSPNVMEAFQKALSEWVNKLPLECCIFVEEPSIIPFNLDRISNQPGIVCVHITDIHTAPYYMPNEVLGFWNSNKHTVGLDKNYLEIDSTKAYSVCLHELGHVFGLTHFINEKNPEAITGSIVIPDSFNAATMIMYPIYSDTNKLSNLSKLEINLAQKNLLNLQQLVNNDCFCLTSH